MNSFRFETYENVITKHHLGSALNWSQGAKWAFLNGQGDKNVTVCSIKQLDADTVEIIKRRDQNLGFSFRYLNMDQKGLYERVTINRKEKTTAVDRMDANWWQPKPFIGRRDLFYMEARGTGPEQMTFVRHDFWIFKLFKFEHQFWSNFAAMSYKRAFRNTA